MERLTKNQRSLSRPKNGWRVRTLRWLLSLMLFGVIVLGGYLVARPYISLQQIRTPIYQWINLNTNFFVTTPQELQEYVQQNAIVPTGSVANAHVINGTLRRHPTNPRYFTDNSGEVIYLTGSHTWLNLQNGGLTDPPPTFDYTAWLDFLEAHNHNFFRLWTWEEAKWLVEWTEPFYFEPMPYQRTGPGNALDGKAKFDLTQFNQAYFDLMRQRVIAARDRGIYVSVMLFNGWSVSYPKGSYNLANPWIGHPYNSSNNINNINGDPNGDNSGDETHQLTVSAVTELQEAYVRKVIDTVNDLDNVLYEISNESDVGSTDWQYHMIDLIKTYEATKPKQHPVGMTVEWPNGDNQKLFASPADWISPNGPIETPPVADGSKVIIGDTDHFCGICGDRQWVWKSFTNGVNPIFMDQYDDGYKLGGGGYDINNPNDVSLRQNLGYTKLYADRINLAAMIPHGELVSSGYALANPAASEGEYLVYLPTGGNVDVDLSATAGELQVEWFNPATGETTAGDAITGGAKRSFTAPFSGDAVLYLYQEQAQQTYQLYIPIIGKGAVNVDPPGPYVSGQQVTLTAFPVSGWSFSGWSGDFITTDNPATLTVTSDHIITATFTTIPVPTYTLTVTTEGYGMVLVNPAGPYLSGQGITLTALAAPQWDFSHWQGAVVGEDNPIHFTITSDSVVTATFTAQPPAQYTVTVAIDGNGTVDLFPTPPYTSGQIITLTAYANEGWSFSTWRGDISDEFTPLSLPITQNLAITATFLPLPANPVRLTTHLVGNGRLHAVPPGPYSIQQVITLTATPDPGWQFLHWQGDFAGGTVAPPSVQSASPVSNRQTPRGSVRANAASQVRAPDTQIETRNPLSITLRHDLTITATFQSATQLLMPLIQTPESD